MCLAVAAAVQDDRSVQQRPIPLWSVLQALQEVRELPGQEQVPPSQGLGASVTLARIVRQLVHVVRQAE